MRVISRVWKRGADRPLVVDLRVVFIDISGGVCVFVRVYIRVLVNPLGLGGAVRVAWLVHGTEGDRYELQPLVRAAA